jgi:hypothetical protein
LGPKVPRARPELRLLREKLVPLAPLALVVHLDPQAPLEQALRAARVRLARLVSVIPDTQEILDRLASRVHPADPLVLQEKVDPQAPSEDPRERLVRLEPQVNLVQMATKVSKVSKELLDPRVRLVLPA